MPIPITLDTSQLKAGTNQLNQYVYPAVSVDAGSVTGYTGTIPMGAHFALPADLDIEHAGLTSERTGACASLSGVRRLRRRCIISHDLDR